MSVENQEVQSTSIATENTVVETPSLSVEEAMRFAFQEDPSVQQVNNVTEQVPVTDAPTVDAPADVLPTFDEIAYIKEQFGVDSKEAIKAAFEELNELKAKAQTPAEFQFANEEAKKLAAAINSGDLKTIKQYADTQLMLSNVDSLTEAEQLKLYIKMKNPRFDQELIDDEYAELYTVKNEDDFDDPIALRKAKVRVQQRMENELAQAKEFFTQHKQSIKLPDIPSIQPTVDEGYEQYKAATATATETLNNVIIPSLKSLNESDLGMKLKINDTDNQMNFDVSVAVDKNDFDSALGEAVNWDAWVEKTFYENGKFQPQKVIQTILKVQKFDSYAQTIARQAVFAERKRMIEKETTGPNLQRQFDSPTGDDEIPAWRKEYERAMSV